MFGKKTLSVGPGSVRHRARRGAKDPLAGAAFPEGLLCS